MITEDYVSFETAKLLKEKGFDVYGDGSYDSGIEIYKEYSPFGKLNSCTTSKPHREAYAAPTLQMAMKWLREVHKLHIVVFHYDNSAFPYIWYIFAHNGDKPHKANSYEEACEAGIKYCLENLI